MSAPTVSIGDRLRIALDLSEAGVALMRQNLRRRFPGESDEEIDQRLRAWREHRPGAEHGDSAGRAVDPKVRFG